MKSLKKLKIIWWKIGNDIIYIISLSGSLSAFVQILIKSNKNPVLKPSKTQKKYQNIYNKDFDLFESLNIYFATIFMIKHAVLDFIQVVLIFWIYEQT